MNYPGNWATPAQLVAAGDAEAVRHFEQAVLAGKHWFIALLEAMGMWSSTEEIHQDRTRRYLIAGEAFDWLLLAERLCEAVDGLLPRDEEEALLLRGRPPLELGVEEIRRILGESKFCQYLNYFYGVTVEEALVQAVKDEVYKERQSLGLSREREPNDEAYQRIYGVAREGLLKCFRQERGYPRLRSITIGEMKEFAYWRFKYRMKHCEKAKVASDTSKALKYLRRRWQKMGLYSALVDGESPSVR